MAKHLINGLLPTANIPHEQVSQNHCEYKNNPLIEPIAVVGFSFEFPQAATSSDTFWELLMSKRNTATEIPESRMSVSALYHPGENRKGQMTVRNGHFLRENIAAFDAPFFSISSSDAALMDPQQRKLLEHTYKALENAGIPLERSSGSKTSVYTGVFTNDWQNVSFKDSEECGITTALGVQSCVNANRISWFYDFKGNSVNIDTACSSSLVALALGCKDLRDGETKMSIVGGSNLIFSPDYLHSLSMMNMLSPDGQCYSFDHRGKGYGRGEGFAILVLKCLSDALRDQDTIRAVIRNTHCNQDGNTPGITQPNSDAQEALIKETYSRAGLSMLSTRYFEAHGTGTSVGDPIETKALGTAFHKTRTSHDPMWVGAVKSNIGHLEGCSGLASVIKTILVLEKGIIPPNANFEQVNSKIDAEFLKIKFPLEPVAWPCKGLRRASVNSFGYAGTNAHAVIDDALHYLEEHGLPGHHITVRDPPLVCPKDESIPPDNLSAMLNGQSLEELSRVPKVTIFSARDEAGVKRVISEYKSHFKQLKIPHDQIEAYLNNLVYTLDRRRTSLVWRSFAIIDSFDDLRRLDEIASPPRVAVSRPALGFIFTGQGAQWAGMGRELGVFPVYEKSLQHAEEYLMELGCSWHLRTELFNQSEQSSIDRPEYSQPICTAVQIALIDLLRHFGVQPAAVVGHSSGEIAAAYSFGAISAKAALRIAYYRGVVSSRIANDNTKRGAMLAVGLSQEDVQPYIDTVASQYDICDLTVACINSGRNVTVSGDIVQVDALKALMDEERILAQKLRIDVAYHSSHMLSVVDSYRTMIGEIETIQTRSRSKIMISSVTGERITAADLRSPEYWILNMVSPVRFFDAISYLIGDTTQTINKKLDLSHQYRLNLGMLVEIGHHSALQNPVRDIISEMHLSNNISYTSILRRKASPLKSTLNAVGEMRCLGCQIDVVDICIPKENRKESLVVLPNLPTYPFDHSKVYWHESRLSKRFRTHGQGRLDLLGKPVSDWNPLEARWRNHLRVTEMPWMEDHVINGATIYPGAGMLVMAIEAAHQMADQSRTILGFELKDVQFLEPLNISPDLEGLETQFSLRLSRGSSGFVGQFSEFRLYSYEKDEWHESCRGFVRVQYAMGHGGIDGGKEALEELAAYRKVEAEMTESCREPTDESFFYANLKQSGFDIGPAFQRIFNGAHGRECQAKGHIRIFEWPESEHPQSHIIHPTTLDAILQMSVLVLTEGGRKTVQTMVPSSLRYLRVDKNGLNYPETSSVKGCVWMTAQDNRGAEFDHSVLDESDSRVLAQVSGMRLTIIASSMANDSNNEDEEPPECYHVEHKPDPDFFHAGRRFLGDKDMRYGLEYYLDILAHKDPGIKVLEVGVDIQESFGKDSQGSNPWRRDTSGNSYSGVSSYHYTASTSSALERVRERCACRPRASFGLLDIEIDPTEQEFEAETYDILVASNPHRLNGGIEMILKHMLKLSKISGRLMFFLENPWDDDDKRDYEHWQEKLTKNDLGSLDSQLPYNVIESSDDFVLLNKFSMSITTSHEHRRKRVVLVVETSSDLQVQLAENIKAELVAQKPDSWVTFSSLSEASNMQAKDEIVFIVLLELDWPLVYGMSASVYPVLQSFLVSAHDILWISATPARQPRKPEAATIDGLARVLRNELHGYRFTTVFFELEDYVTERQLHLLLQVLHKNHFHSNSDPSQDEPEYLIIDDVLNIPRLYPREDLSQELDARSLPQRSGVTSIQNAPPLKLTVGSPGILDSLHLTADTDYSRPLVEGEVEIRTEAVGVNFKDCLVALGQVSGSSLGLECAGTVTRVGNGTELTPGDRVVMAAQGCFKTFARGTTSEICKIPDNMSFVEMAAIPAQFGTAWAIVKCMAKVQAGEFILIHAAAGGTGQACIQVAQFLGAIVLATVSTLEKKRILMEEYGITEEHIFDSRNLSFAKGVQRMTKGRGADVVINSLVGEAMVASWECIAPYGRFVEIGKMDIVANSKLPMSSFARNATFMGFDMSTSHEERPSEMKRNLEVLMGMFDKKQLHVQRPLHVHSIADVQKAFRLLSSGQSAGKLVVEVSQDAQVPITLDTTAGFNLDPNATYVIAGGLGGLGRCTARWMINRKARNLILLSRSGARTEDARTFVQELTGNGVRVEAPACDVTKTEAMHRVLGNLIQRMPPVKGCVQASMVSKDVLFEDMTFDDWQNGVNCKTSGTWNLHNVLPESMDFFILLSSASGLIGLRGQANYNAGNTYEDAFARYRVSFCGMKTISLNLGAMVDDGILAKNRSSLERVLRYGVLRPITRRRFFGILDYCCDPKVLISTANESQIAIGVATRKAHDGGFDINLHRHPLFRHVLYENKVAALNSNSKRATSKDDDANTRSLFSASQCLSDAANIVVGAIIKKLSKNLPMLPQTISDLDIHRPIQSYAVDSLLAVELRNWIKKELRAEVAVFETQGGATFATLGRCVAEKSTLKHEKWKLRDGRGIV